MDVERREGGIKTPEKMSTSVEIEPTVSQEAAVERDPAQEAALAQRRQEAERAARATREMKDPLLVRIEAILSEGLSDEYATLSPEKKKAFKEEGERLSTWLHSALATGTVTAHEVLTRLEAWLLVIEGKDRASPWLLQEAYIRARRVMKDLMHQEMGH